MNVDEARMAIRNILASIPAEQLPQPSRREDMSHETYGTCYWFGGHGYYVGSCRDGKGASIPSDHRGFALLDALERETMQRLEDAFWAAKTAVAS